MESPKGQDSLAWSLDTTINRLHATINVTIEKETLNQEDYYFTQNKVNPVDVS
jgi:hypothetical protein